MDFLMNFHGATFDYWKVQKTGLRWKIFLGIDVPVNSQIATENR